MTTKKDLIPLYLSSVLLILCVVGAFWIPYYVKTTTELPYTPEVVSETFRKYFENLNEPVTAEDMQQLKDFTSKYLKVLFSSESTKKSIQDLYFTYAFFVAAIVLLHLSTILKYVRKTSL